MTSQLMTAEEMAREFVTLNLKDGDLDEGDYVTVSGLTRVTIANALSKLLTTYAAQVREAALEEVGRLCDEVAARYQLISRSVRANASQDCASELGKAIRALKASPPAADEVRG